MRPWHKHTCSILERVFPPLSMVAVTDRIEFTDGTVIEAGEGFVVTGHDYVHLGVFVAHPLRGETLLTTNEIERMEARYA